MLGQSIPDLLRFYLGNHWFCNRGIVILFLGVAHLPLTFFRNLSSFAIGSFITVGTVIFITFMVLFTAVTKIGIPDDIPRPDNAFTFAHLQFLSALGGMSYTFVCHDLSFAVFNELQNPTRKRYYFVVNTTMVLTVFVVSTIGLGGYFLFYDQNIVIDNIVENMPRHSLQGVLGMYTNNKQ